MSKRGGFGPGMPGNMNNLLKQAERLQRQMEEKRRELSEAEFTGTAGGGAVSVVLSGLKDLKKVHIDPEALDPEDVDTLENMIVMAYDDAAKKIDAQNEDISGNAGLLGGFGL